MILVLMALYITSCDSICLSRVCGGKQYIINMFSKNVISGIRLIKEQNPDLEVWTTGRDGNLGTADNYMGDYYRSYFHVPVEGDTIVAYVAVNIKDIYPAAIYLMGINRNPEFDGTWRRLDKLDKEERETVETAFEELILPKIKEEMLRKYGRQRTDTIS